MATRTSIHSLLFCSLLLRITQAATPNAEILVNGVTHYAALGTFSSLTTLTGTLGLPPENVDAVLCLEGDDADYYNQIQFTQDIMLVPRGGGCKFAHKTQMAARMGARGVIIYNTLESRYGGNDTIVEYPIAQQDYECENGESKVNASQFPELDPPAYEASIHDSYLTLGSPDNLCFVDDECESRRCLITGPSANGTFQACCAWDILVQMTGTTNNNTEDTVAVFITMQQSQLFLELAASTAVVTIQERWYPKFNASSVVLWLLATCIVAFAAWYSAKDYRKAGKEWRHGLRITTTTPNVQRESENTAQQQEEEEVNQESRTEDNAQDSTQDNDVEEASPLPHDNAPNTENETSEPPAPQTPPAAVRAHGTNDAAIELNAWHAAGFVIVASSLLLVLFYFQIYSWVTVLYGIGCSGALAQLIFYPLYSVVSKRIRPLHWCFSSITTRTTFCGLNQIQWVEVFAGLSGYLIGAMWLLVAFTNDTPSSNAFFWITQDVMGACISILFLSLLKLNSIKVATILLVAVFIYDIFFVFISPYVFNGDNVMVTVATSGGGGDGTQDFCEKYPDDSSCDPGNPLPLLLSIPRINDYRGGQSLLGLGDIVLPGLLISFAARLDESKRLVAGLTNINICKLPVHWYNGYLLPLVVAYAVGLFFANLAVVLMERGQPALLYLVPACLGTMVFVGRGELGELWKGPQVIKVADRLAAHRPNPQSPPTEERSVEIVDPSTESSPTSEAGSTRSIL